MEILLYICKMYRNLFYNNLFHFEAINSLSCLTVFVCNLRPTCCFEHSSDRPGVDLSGSAAAPSLRPRWLIEVTGAKMSKAPHYGYSVLAEERGQPVHVGRRLFQTLLIQSSCQDSTRSCVSQQFDNGRINRIN